MIGRMYQVCKYYGGRRVLHISQELRRRGQLQLSRHLVSTSGQWEPEFNEQVRQDIEKYWKDKLKNHDLQFQFKEGDGSKRYVLSMFPYPSGALHMGHVRVYTISDVMARFYRLRGDRVLHPMGWDAFGLPAENAAIDRGEKPQKWTTKNIKNMRRQLDQLSLSFDWDREYSTCDPAYYRWTQHIFLKMFEAGLVYQKEAAVNWDPVDQTVLADEQIDSEGRSWRSGAVAEKRTLKQWYIRTTAYSKSLIAGLEEVDSSLWRDVLDLQKHWIGVCDGVRLELQLMCDGEKCREKLSVFTRSPALVYGVSHILVAPHHSLNRMPYVPAHSQDKACRLTVDAIHPFTGNRIPIYLHLQHDFGDHLDSHLGIPSSRRVDANGDAAFAQKHDLDFVHVLAKKEEAGTDEILINSEQFSGLSEEEAFQLVADCAMKLRCGGYVTSERARDWLISRQRYWGTPIPIIHCSDCGTLPVPYKDLPVVLPELDQLTGKGLSPLNQATDWLNTTCPRCRGKARRETDTMDTFVDSSWYFLRYLDPTNSSQPFSMEKAQALMPVDLYIGGKEHAIMHLYYARFFAHFLFDAGLVPAREPFVNLLTQGMVMGQSYKLSTGRYIPPGDVEKCHDGTLVQRGTGDKLTVNWEKMSKSKYNGVDPQDILKEYGTDSTRLCILAGVAPKTERHWDSHDLVGIVRWQTRMWGLVTNLHTHANQEITPSISEKERQKWDAIIFEARNDTIREVTWNLSKTFLLNTAISYLQSFTKTLQKMPPELTGVCRQYDRAVADLVVMITPFAPMYAAEMWQGVCAATTSQHSPLDKDVLFQKWPQVDSDYHLKLKVKRSHKSCFDITLPVSIGNEAQLGKKDLEALVMSHPAFAELLGDLKPDRYSMRVQPGYKVVMTYTESRAEEKARKRRELAALKKNREQRLENVQNT